MIKSDIKPQNLPEKLTWFYIIGIYGVYLLGAQFFFAILFALFLVAYGVKQWWERFTDPLSSAIPSMPATIWLLSMLTIGLALVVGHLDFDYGVVNIAKSSLKWLPFALFPLAGYLVNLRPELIYRAVSILCLQSLILIPILAIAVVLHIPNHLYTSPLAVLGGEVSRYQVILYFTEGHETRLVLFAPHCPALGLVGGIFFCLTQQDPNTKWRWIGIVGALSMVLVSISRAAILSIPIVLLCIWVTQNLVRPWFHFLLASVSLLGGLFLSKILEILDLFKSEFYSYRAGSSRTRAILEQMALDRWSEAPIWGHGVIEATGPEITGQMAIGTHHTWFGLLFTQGLVGCIALAIGFVGSFVNVLFQSHLPKSIQVSSLGILMMMLIFTFADIIYDYSYLYWPGLLLIGMSFKVNATTLKPAL